jgi:hypothetical protein
MMMRRLTIQILIILLIYLINKVYPLIYLTFYPLEFIKDLLYYLGNEINNYITSYQILVINNNECKIEEEFIENLINVNNDNKSFIIISIVLLISYIAISYHFGDILGNNNEVKLDKLGLIKKSLNETFNRNEQILNELENLLK